eukprot:5608648-Prymnesium_polylepis.2
MVKPETAGSLYEFVTSDPAAIVRPGQGAPVRDDAGRVRDPAGGLRLRRAQNTGRADECRLARQGDGHRAARVQGLPADRAGPRGHWCASATRWTTRRSLRRGAPRGRSTQRPSSITLLCVRAAAGEQIDVKVAGAMRPSPPSSSLCSLTGDVRFLAAGQLPGVLRGAPEPALRAAANAVSASLIVAASKRFSVNVLAAYAE